jgi:threonine synthase
MLVLETALPIKFASTIEEALGKPPQRPPGLEGLEDTPRRVRVMPADVTRIKAYIAARAQPDRRAAAA